jgi:thiamine pyrophosphokinase
MPAEGSLLTLPNHPSSGQRRDFLLRAVIFANGVLNDPEAAKAMLQAGDVIIAADGGALHCRRLGLLPQVLIGDFDSLDAQELAGLQAAGSETIRHPARKDYTDLELALIYARDRGMDEILVMGALGARWDQTLANLLLPATQALASLRISLVDGPQEILLLRGGSHLEVRGRPGDLVSLIPLGGDASGVITRGLEYPLEDEMLPFGGTRGISNVLLGEKGDVSLRQGILLCVVIHS